MFTFSTSEMMCLTHADISTQEHYLKSHRVPDDWSMTTYKMFEETARSKLTTQLTWIKEGKMRQNLHSRDGLMH